MAAKKKMAISKPAGPRSWEEDSEKYPLKRGMCEFCGQRDDLKLSYDMVRYICLSPHPCILRWIKMVKEDKEAGII